MDLIELFNRLICLPDRGKTSSLCRHDIDTDTEICTQTGYSRSYKFHNFILHIAVGKYFTDNCQCNVLWSYTRTRFPFQIDCYNTRHINIIGLGKKLFNKFSTTLTHCHGAKCTITSMTVGTKDHLTATGKHFTCELMDDCLMRWYINSTVFLGTGKSKHMIIFVDRSTYCTKRIVAVGQYIWNREFLKS